MAEPSHPQAGPSQSGLAPQNDPSVLRQFVMEYLQQHGFDRALASLTAPDPNQDADGEDEPMSGAGAGAGGDAPTAGARRASGGAATREARFLAPGPVPIDSALKRNIPQAMTGSVSTFADKVTPEFEAQATYIIDMLSKRMGKDVGEEEPLGEAPESLLDPSDRADGYKRYRRWVDGGLDLWKPELDALCFPIFAHTFLDLMHYGFVHGARSFFDNNKIHHSIQHPQEVSTLSSIVDRQHLRSNPYCQQLLTDRYTIALSRNSHQLLLQWLSGASLDESYENGRLTSAGRGIEAVKSIVQSRITLQVVDSSIPLSKVAIASSSGLLPSSIRAPSLEAFNSATKLKLGPVPISDKLREQVSVTIQEEDAAAKGVANGTQVSPSQPPSALPNGNAENGHANGDGDIEMTDAQAAQAVEGMQERDAKEAKEKATIIPELKISLDSDLISPSEGELIPPPPSVFRIADLKREVEAVRDKRKMIRLGTQRISEGSEAASSSLPPVLPSVVAFTVFDGGEGVSSVEFSQDASVMAVGSPESCIRLWSLKGEKLKGKKIDPLDGELTEDEGLPMRKLVGHSGPVYSLSFDPIYGSSSSPQTLLSSSQDGTVRLWSMDTYSNLVVYRGHNRDPVWDVQWGPMGVYFATASRDRTARLWCSDRTSPVRMYTGHMGDVNCVRFHPNSLYLATGSYDKSVRMWDVQRGACIRLLTGHTDSVTTLAISPDGRTLASAGLDSKIMLWDLGTARQIKTMSGHKSAISSLSFSAESSTLVSAGLDSTVRVWDVKSSGGTKATGGMDDVRKGVEASNAHGALPMGPGDGAWDDVNSTSDLLATFHTKRTPVLKAHHTPRNLCMVAGAFIPPSNA